MMAPQLDYQNDDALPCPERAQVEHWIATALAEAGAGDACELTVRIVASAEMQALNHRYRGFDSPTNVLAFEAELPPGIDLPLLGDIVICAPVVEREAAQQGKPASAHWAHMAVHGALHLLGHDHQDSDQADAMEHLETVILARLGFPDPYDTPPTMETPTPQ